MGEAPGIRRRTNELTISVRAKQNRREFCRIHKNQQVWDRLRAGPAQAISRCHTSEGLCGST